MKNDKKMIEKITEILKIKLIKLNFVHPGKGVDNPSHWSTGFLHGCRGDRTHVGQFWFSPICGEVYFEKRVLLVSHETTCIYAPPDFFLDF